jgi:hypothetical protein
MAKCKWCGKEFKNGAGFQGASTYCSTKRKVAHENSKKKK